MKGKRLRTVVDLHRCTDAENMVQKLPLFATFPSARWSWWTRTARRMSNRHQRIGTGLCVVGRCRKKVANTRGKMAQRDSVFVHYVKRMAEDGNQGGGQDSGVRVRVRVRAGLKRAMFAGHVGRARRGTPGKGEFFFLLATGSRLLLIVACRGAMCSPARGVGAEAARGEQSRHPEIRGENLREAE